MNVVKGLRNIADWSQSPTKPRSDGTRVLFETEIAGRMIACTISRGALRELSGCHHIASGELLHRFMDGRDRIERIAADIFAMRPNGVVGTLHIWADDIYDPPSAPAIARQAALNMATASSFPVRCRDAS
jgi:hypothetical protein